MVKKPDLGVIRERLKTIVEFVDDSVVQEKIDAALSAHASFLRSDPNVAKKSIKFSATHRNATLSWSQIIVEHGEHRHISISAYPGSGQPGDIIRLDVAHPIDSKRGKFKFADTDSMIKMVRGL